MNIADALLDELIAIYPTWLDARDNAPGSPSSTISLLQLQEPIPALKSSSSMEYLTTLEPTPTHPAAL